MHQEDPSKKFARLRSAFRAFRVPRGVLLTVLVAVATSTVFTFLVAGFAYRYRADLFPENVSYLHEQPVSEVQTRVRSDEPIVDVVARASDAVVSVVITKDIPVLERYYERVDPFEDFGFFGGGFEVPRVRQLGTEEREVGGGTGFFVSSDGLLVTNRHVVDDEEARYSVVTNKGKHYEAEVLVRDTRLDIAVLRVADIPEGEHSHLAFGDSSALLPGQTVIAIGNALTEFRNSVSVGVVSGLSRTITAGDRYGGDVERLDGVIQTDAAINPGNSGGPLLNLKGEVVGVNVAVAGGAENIGFAIPSQMVSSAVASVREHGEIRRPYLGVRYIELSDTVARNNELPVSYGAWLKGGAEGPAIIKDSPAARAGLREDDIIVSFNGISLEDRPLGTLVQGGSVGQTVTLEYLRSGEHRTVDVVLERMPEEKGA